VNRPEIRFPEDDRGVVLAPAGRELPRLVRANRELRAGYAFVHAGRSAAELGAETRSEIMSAAAAYTSSLGVPPPTCSEGPVIQTGHQPEFYHPGIWMKNHLAAKLARAAGGIGLNLVMDSDVPRVGDLAFPVRVEGGGFQRHGEPFATIDSARAYEEHRDKDSWRFDRLAGEVTRLIVVRDERLVIARFMADAAELSRRARDIAHLMTLLRRRYEEKIGLDNLEIPVSLLSDTRAFALFVLGIAAAAERFAGIYDSTLEEYRRLAGIRSGSRPLPDLRMEGKQTELPFWVWTPGASRRRLHVRADRGADLLMDDRVVFSIDERSWAGMLSGERTSFDETAERMLREGRGRFRIRPRAVSTTIFCRMFLSDAFVHGVGGARYDTIADEIIRRFFAVEPPGFVTCSATLLLPMRVESARAGDIRRIRHTLRDLLFNAERHMDAATRRSSRVENVLTEKRSLIDDNRRLRSLPAHGERSELRARRREIFDRIRQRNREMTAVVEPQASTLQEELGRIERDIEDESVVRRRDYSFVLYPEKFLLDFYAEKIDFA
jgi:hypothetical protein